MHTAPTFAGITHGTASHTNGAHPGGGSPHVTTSHTAGSHVNMYSSGQKLLSYSDVYGKIVFAGLKYKIV